ncbi:hypothetical protein TRM7557_00148 [Tritonibacter multivorans]|uniref:AAA+ ATPase domain-containing protein n=1 Tax=Tritonibacter multivorans TaxID=928856 RepID=A0A0P1FZW1_9RHOB|nr:AAA family ATPase [Tritonibacter multivorans]MDA7422447.1 ATPase [Tritonibacter multivorans]CUH74925.1 hypothetical protein TRM7557_00148 [Tritonibacter multivorans]SFD43780.1 hypothetical protein SAMN04488049_11358 [Tritonibacter multivorans]
MLDPLSPQQTTPDDQNEAYANGADIGPNGQTPTPQSGTFHAAGEPPRRVADTDLPVSFLIDLTAKILQSGGTMTPSEISAEIKLPRMVCRQIIEEMTRLMLVEAQGLEGGDIKSDIRYRLTDLGAKRALEALMVSQYVGPAPVTLAAFEDQIRRQTIASEEINSTALDAALTHMVIPEVLKSQLGPAVNSGRSMLLFGAPGNGKTALAEALGDCFRDIVSIPYALFVGGQIIRFYDETLHEQAPPPTDAPRLDPRWVPCRRPVFVAGGELTLAMLDLSFEPHSRFYEAPMHLKALGGIFVLDDFGRQTEVPQAFLNRWIVPLEKGFDILSLHTGKKFNLPFDQLVVFSSNLLPEELGDEAALRRIYFKIFVPNPSRADYMQIFEDACADMNIAWQPDVVETFYDRRYVQGGYNTSGAHPGFLLRHIIAACRFLEIEPELTDDLLELSWRNVAAGRSDA